VANVSQSRAGALKSVKRLGNIKDSVAKRGESIPDAATSSLNASKESLGSSLETRSAGP
jgi:hypothetical protein